MNPKLRLIAEQIIREHPNLIEKLFRNLKKHLPFGVGEGKVKDALAENIPEWIYDLSEGELRQFIETLQRDPDFYIWLKYQISDLEKTLYEE